ncbi:hypothetical protein HXX76_000425 [Chlamydomonas incerta]|uniref:Uncharacterized protein n=1 Tax=Chlamydomonas incerta TaxID=51695 RepID=A0A836B2J4_CHLIN|nr:hypothetical protein HXX76_000425 [Chlamydomonas incerta]|eukprot:KAG2445821.1 hypothetical protein HXX76_000425 [Chlamydomonas incerta]
MISSVCGRPGAAAAATAALAGWRAAGAGWGGLSAASGAGPAATAYSSSTDYSGGGTGTSMGSHPLYELDKIQRTARGEIDSTEAEPMGTSGLPHPTGRMAGGVEARAEPGQTPSADELKSDGSGALPDFYVGEQPPGQRRPGAPGSGDATQLSDPGLATGRAAGAEPHAGTNSEGSYGGQSADYYHGMKPVVTDPMTGLASGTVMDASEKTRREVGPAVIRGPGSDAVGVNTRPNTGADVSA